MLASCGDAGRFHPQTIQEFGDTITYFYNSPSQDLLNRIINESNWQESEFIKTGNGDLLPIFFSVCANKYKYSLKDGDSKSIQLARNMTDVDQYLFDDNRISPGQNDGLWVAFFASGDDKYLDKLFARATTQIPPNVIDDSYSSAAWSYKANCKQHPSVFAHLKRQVETDTNKKYIIACMDWVSSKNNN